VSWLDVLKTCDHYLCPPSPMDKWAMLRVMPHGDTRVVFDPSVGDDAGSGPWICIDSPVDSRSVTIGPLRSTAYKEVGRGA